MIKFTDKLNIYVLLVINAIIASFIFYLLYKFQFKFNTENLVSIALLLLASTFLFVIGSRIEITSSNIRLNFLMIKTVIDFNEITEIKIEKIKTFSKFLGYGYRINFNNEIGYVFGSSTCLKITTKEKTYYASFKEKDLNRVLNNGYIKIDNTIS